MKFIKQFGIILSISFIGEILNFLIPLPVPASIYGMILMFVFLKLKIIKVSDVKETSLFLIDVMPLMFIPAAVGLITAWNVVSANLLAYLAITVITTFLVMIVSGHVSQFVIRRTKKESDQV